MALKWGNAEIEPPKSISTATAVTAQIIALCLLLIFMAAPPLTVSMKCWHRLSPPATTNIARPQKSGASRTQKATPILTIKEQEDAFQSLEYEVNTPAYRQRSNAVCNFWFWSGHQLGIALIQESILRNRIAGLGKTVKLRCSRNWCLRFAMV